jgi:putative redox protein
MPPTTAKICWVDGALFVAEGGSGHTITMDGAPDIGGRNLASRPMEVVLMGMGGCTAIDVVSMLRKQRQDIEGIEVSLVAELLGHGHDPKISQYRPRSGAGRSLSR